MSTIRTHFEGREVTQDVRSIGRKISDAFAADASWVAMIGITVLIFLYPGWADVLSLIAMAVAGYGFYRIRQFGWPLKSPIFSKVTDPADLDPVSGQPRQAEGIFYLGAERFTGRGLFLTNADLRAHLYAMGVSGSGKTEMLLGVLWNAFVQGSGAVLIDGKGEIAIATRAISLARAFLREDDVLIINFQTGGKDRIQAEERRTSNIGNFFALGASTEMSEMMTSLLDAGPNTDRMWTGRAEAIIKSLMKPLVWLRDYANEPLSPSRFRDAIELREIMKIYRDERIPERIRAGLDGYLKTLPGGIPKPAEEAMTPAELQEMRQTMQSTLSAPPPAGVSPAVYESFKKKIQEQIAALDQGQSPNVDANEATREEQHGYVIMQLTKSLGIMADTYWYITDSEFTEIDWVDVALNRRVVIVLLPTLGLSQQGSESLGKLVTAAIKAMMNRVLGDTVERRIGEPGFEAATKANHPFYIIFDEKPAYIVEGEDVIATQARSLGFCVVYGAQAHEHMKLKSEITAAAIAGAATRVKLVLGVEDIPTMEMAAKLGGEVWKPVQSAYEYDSSAEIGGMRPGNAVSIQKEALVNHEELKAQKEGQAHVFMSLQRKSGEIQRLIKANLIYVTPKEPDAIHIQHLAPLIDPEKVRQLPAEEAVPTAVEGQQMGAAWQGGSGGAPSAKPESLFGLTGSGNGTGEASGFVETGLLAGLDQNAQAILDAHRQSGQYSEQELEGLANILRNAQELTKKTIAGLPVSFDVEYTDLVRMLRHQVGR